jgi:hypothetical protein
MSWAGFWWAAWVLLALWITFDVSKSRIYTVFGSLGCAVLGALCFYLARNLSIGWK